jgi:hypothetical protein
VKLDDNPYRPPDSFGEVACQTSPERRWKAATLWKGAKLGFASGVAIGLINYAYILGTFLVAYDFDLRRTIKEMVIEVPPTLPAFFVVLPSLVGAVLGIIGLGLARRVGRRLSPPANDPTRE